MTAPRPGRSVRGDAWRSYLESTAMLIAELERRLKADSGMDMGDFNVLLVLSETRNRRIRLGELARAVAFGPARLTYRLDRLVQRGWVRREPSAEDGRGLEAVLTDEGFAALRAARVPHGRDVHELLLHDVSDEQAQTLLDVFGPLRDRLT